MATEPHAGVLYSTSTLSLFSEELVPSKLTLDVHLLLSSLIYLNNGKLSNIKLLAMLLNPYRWAQFENETQGFLVSKETI